MILIPELETVVILVPRTGSGAVRRAIQATHPKAMQVYRHMEADGIPLGYDRWARVGVVRHPTERLWSLYKFLQRFGGPHDPDYIAAMRGSVEGLTFSEWIVSNHTVFTAPYDSSGRGRFWPHFTVRHPLPETRKSQWMYLRPDLGTDVYDYREMALFTARLGVSGAIGRQNETDPSPVPPLSMAAELHMRKWFAWDFEVTA